MQESLTLPSLANLKALRDQIAEKRTDLAKKLESNEITDLETQIADLNIKLGDLKESMGIHALENEIDLLMVEYNDVLQAVGQSITTWTPDKIAKSKEIYRADGLKILRSHRTVREIRAAELFETFPFLAPKIAKVTLKDAEKWVAPADLERFVDRKTSYSYEIV